MPTLNQTKALEEAAQRLAKHAGRDYSKIRMVDHYLRRKGRKDPAIADLVAEADAIVRVEYEHARAARQLAAVVAHDLERHHARRRQRGNLLRRQAVLGRLGHQVAVDDHELGQRAAL